MKRHAAPIIATILLLLPLLYVGSYLPLVSPAGQLSAGSLRARVFSLPRGILVSNYRAFPIVAPRFFWPLEWVDRKVRPGFWSASKLQS
jgi:hypothetical protein